MPTYIDLNNPKIIYMGRDKFGNGIYHIPPDLPTADVVERKKGKWVNNIHDMPICNQCGYMTPYDRAIDDYEYGNYCPNCGAEMEAL